MIARAAGICKEGPGSPITGRSAQRQRSGRKPEAAFYRDFGRYRPPSAQERRRTASIAAARLRNRLAEFGERSGRIEAPGDGRLQPGGGIGDGKSADRAGRALQRMRQRAGVRRHGGERARPVWPIGPRTSPTPPARGRRRRASCAGDVRNRSARRREPAAAMASILSVRDEAAWPKSGSPRRTDSGGGVFPSQSRQQLTERSRIRRNFDPFLPAIRLDFRTDFRNLCIRKALRH